MIDPIRGEWTSASNALADRLCRGRHQAQLGLPELPGTEESRSGRIIHALWTGSDPQTRPTPEEKEKAAVLGEQEAAVAGQFFGTNEGLVRIVEHRLWYEFEVAGDDGGKRILKTSGQFDVALVQPKSWRALVLDGKSGWRPVSPNASNLQLRRLAALLWQQLGSAEIGVGILKPFARPETPCIYTLPDLQQSVCELEEDVRQSHIPQPPRTAGEEQCRYCRAREGCPTRLAWLSAALPVTSPALPMIPARDWTPAQRALFLEREKDVRDWLEARKAEIKALLKERPEAVPGYALRPGRNIETITHSQEVLKRFCGNWGGTLEAFLKCIKVGKSALKEELRALTGHQGRALDASLDELLAGCVEARLSEPTIERLNDRLASAGHAQSDGLANRAGQRGNQATGNETTQATRR
jgi:hypothetical protein